MPGVSNSKVPLSLALKLKRKYLNACIKIHTGYETFLIAQQFNAKKCNLTLDPPSVPISIYTPVSTLRFLLLFSSCIRIFFLAKIRMFLFCLRSFCHTYHSSIIFLKERNSISYMLSFLSLVLFIIMYSVCLY